MKSENSQKICQLYAKMGKSKNRTSLLSESSVFMWRSVAECNLLPFLGIMFALKSVQIPFSNSRERVITFIVHILSISSDFSHSKAAS